MKFNENVYENVYENVSKFNELNYAADSSEFPANFQRISSEFQNEFGRNDECQLEMDWQV